MQYLIADANFFQYDLLSLNKIFTDCIETFLIYCIKLLNLEYRFYIHLSSLKLWVEEYFMLKLNFHTVLYCCCGYFAFKPCTYWILFRDQLKRNYNLGQFWLDVEIEDVSSFDETLADKLTKIPTEHLPLVRYFRVNLLLLILWKTVFSCLKTYKLKKILSGRTFQNSPEKVEF